MENYNSLSVLVTVPLVLSIFAWFMPKGVQRLYGIFCGLSFLALTLFESYQVLFSTVSAHSANFVEQKLAWLPAMGISFNIRLDLVSGWFVLLNAVVAVIAFSLRGQWYRKNPRLFTSLGFFLVMALNAAFLSTDLIVFYLAYEAVFIPMIFMVGLWGESAKAAAVFRFFLMSFLGSVLMLVSIFFLMHLYHSQTGQYSSNIADLLQISAGKSDPQLAWCFWGFFLAFAIKVPLVPFHGWLKDVYTLAPMPATIWLSAILSKLGVYGFIRFVFPLFAEVAQAHQGLLLTLAAISVIYAAFLAIQAKKPKELLAYSSISQLGFVMLGIFAMNLNGISAAILLSVGHTLVSAMLFFCLHLIDERKEQLGLENMQGLAKIYPTLFVGFFIAILASVSLPGTLNFAGEFLVLLNAYPTSAFCTIAAGFGVILGAVYSLRLYQQLAFGKVEVMPAHGAAKDVGAYDLLLLTALVVVLIYFGFHPNIFLKGNG
jgi:NADH-quinone oxidoreductase subunit M